MRTPRRDEARRQPGSGKAMTTTTNANPATGRPEHQGKTAPARNRDQRAPAWPAPAGHDAALLLQRCWTMRRRT